jgi:phage FluMu gp28-like protein
VLEAASSNGSDTFYIGYNKEMAEGYISDCADWAKAFNIVSSGIREEVVVENEDRDIITYSIQFASGYKIEALSAKPRSIRSKGKPRSRLRIDELAFHDEPKEVLKAAIAFKMWGGKIAIWSTHNGVNNEFNRLIQRIKKGELPTYSLHTYTFTDALKDGLYKRICYVLGEKYTLEKELEK